MCVGWTISVLYYVLREDRTDKVSFEQRPEGSPGISHADIWERSFQAGRKASTKSLRQECAWYVLGSQGEFVT